MTFNNPHTYTGIAASAPVLERIDPYEEWRNREGVPLVGGIYIRNMRQVELGDWPRKGAKGAIAYLDGDDPNDAHLPRLCRGQIASKVAHEQEPRGQRERDGDPAVRK